MFVFEVFQSRKRESHSVKPLISHLFWKGMYQGGLLNASSESCRKQEEVIPAPWNFQPSDWRILNEVSVASWPMARTLEPDWAGLSASPCLPPLIEHVSYFNLPKPQLPHLQNGVNRICLAELWWGLKAMNVKRQTFGRLSEMLVIIKVAQNTCKMLKGRHVKQGGQSFAGWRSEPFF